MEVFEPPLNLGERVSLLDRQHLQEHSIDPEELHFSTLDGDIPTRMTASSSRSGSLDSSVVDNSILPDPMEWDVHSRSARSMVDIGSVDGKRYAPRQNTGSRKSTKAPTRVKPRNGQHARELERNRQAAANYRSRQKNQLDTLLSRVRNEETRMLKQKGMIYSLKDELFQLRNQLMAHQQAHIFGMREMNQGQGLVESMQQPVQPTFGIGQ